MDVPAVNADLKEVYEWNKYNEENVEYKVDASDQLIIYGTIRQLWQNKPEFRLKLAEVCTKYTKMALDSGMFMTLFSMCDEIGMDRDDATKVMMDLFGTVLK